MNKSFSEFLNIAKAWGTKLAHASPAGSEEHILGVYRQSADKLLLVGRLSSEQGEFVFRYDLEYKGEAISAFPDTAREYRSRDLWPFFAIRIPPFDRADMREAIKNQSLDKEHVIGILGHLARVSATNPYKLEFVHD